MWRHASLKSHGQCFKTQMRELSRAVVDLLLEYKTDISVSLAMHASNKFTLYGGNDAFADRQKKLFDQLSIAEKECNRGRTIDTETVPMDVESLSTTDEEKCPPRSNRKRKSEMRQFRGKESIFKRPEGPAPRTNSHSIPDHHRNPHKWMKYSLDDVSTDDMTDRSNARTAFAFLKELKARREKEEEEALGDSDLQIKSNKKDSQSFKEPKQSTSIQFKKPKQFTSKANSCQNPAVVVEREEKPVFLSTKVLMPEYVVGQKQKKKKDKDKRGTLTAKADRVKELKLNHLEEFDEEDETI